MRLTDDESMTFFRLKTEIIIFIGDLDSYGIRYNSYPGSALAFMRIRILGEGISNQNPAFQTKIASIEDKWHKIGKKYLLRQFQLIDSVSVLCLGHFGDFCFLDPDPQGRAKVTSLNADPWDPDPCTVPVTDIISWK